MDKEAWKARVGREVERESEEAELGMLSLKNGSPARVRFLQEVHEGLEFLSHRAGRDDVQPKACLRLFGRRCPRHTPEYADVVRVAYSVWSHDVGGVRLVLLYKRRWSLGALLEADDLRGTIRDRDFVIERSGKKVTVTPVPSSKSEAPDPYARPLGKEEVARRISRYTRVAREVGG